MRIPRDLRDLYQLAVRRGWVITYAGSGHLKWRSPAGVLVVTGSTPGKGRSIDNCRAKLNRAGLKIERG